ncbi:MAG: YdcF family protein [Leptolyngbya sp. BL-A-14]
MLDPTLCIQKPLTHSWTSLSWMVFNWLTMPALVIPPLVVMMIAPWLFRRLRWRRRISGLGATLLALYLLTLSPTMLKIGSRVLVSFLPSDSGVAADAIVVLGRGTEMRPERVAVSAQLWEAARAPLIFASGWGDAQEIAAMLEQRGIPTTAIDGEPCSRTTEENARFTAALLQPKNVRRILLVTDPPHMLRSLLTFRSLGFEVTPHTNPLPQQLNPRAKAYLVFREYLGIVGYGLRGRFLPREPSAADISPTAIAPIQEPLPPGAPVAPVFPG